MKFARFLLTLLVLMFCKNALIYAQDIKIPQNALLKHLLRDSLEVAHISLSQIPIIPQPAEFSKNYQQLVKSGNNLYLFIDGTGRVYKVSKWDDQNVNFTRIDSTTYFGYNKSSVKFMVGDSIFSYGGYGFWHFNGCLSYFSPHHKEWEMTQLNQDIPFYNFNDRISSISQFDNRGNFYFSAAPIDHQTIFKENVNDSFYVINIKQRNIQSLGKNLFSSNDFIKFTTAKKVETPYGILFDCPLADNRDFILNIKENKVYASERRILQSLIPSKAYTSDNILFYQNGFLFVSSAPFDKMDSLKFDFHNFTLLENRIYEPITIPNILEKFIFQNGMEISISLFLFIAIILLLLYFIFKRRSLNKKVESIKDQQEILSPLEKQLLKNFISIVESKGECSTDELNNLLGVGFKTNEIKKKARTDFITKVNYKLRAHFSIQTDIIIRDRSELDKRSYLYSIEKNMINQIKKLL